MISKARNPFSAALRLSNISSLRRHEGLIRSGTRENSDNYMCFLSSQSIGSSSGTEKANEMKPTPSEKKIMMSRDPLAKKPNSQCDPYGQGGKPLNYQEVSALLNTTLEKGWYMNFSPLAGPIDKEKGAHAVNQQEEGGDVQRRNPLPMKIFKEYHHENVLQGTKFISLLGSLCLVHNHFASFHLERRLISRPVKNNLFPPSSSSGWDFVTTVTCCTPTLGGLSYNDFHLAMMIDVECQKLQHLLLPERSA